MRHVHWRPLQIDHEGYTTGPFVASWRNDSRVVASGGLSVVTWRPKELKFYSIDLEIASTCDRGCQAPISYK